jgi:hypothetical protein
MKFAQKMDEKWGAPGLTLLGKTCYLTRATFLTVFGCELGDLEPDNVFLNT